MPISVLPPAGEARIVASRYGLRAAIGVEPTGMARGQHPLGADHSPGARAICDASGSDSGSHGSGIPIGFG